ncbi:hypothetical protein N9B94_00385 [Verrucomicrobia bacterium]|nr:hypothetical protein [Verrucomicrobiota bacterium]
MLGSCSQCNETVEFDAHMEGGQAECPFCNQAFMCENDVTENEFYGGSSAMKKTLIASICTLVAAGAIGGGYVAWQGGGEKVADADTEMTEEGDEGATSELASLFSSDNGSPSGGSSRGGGMDEGMMGNEMSMGGDMAMGMEGDMAMGMDMGMGGGSATFTGKILPIMKKACTKCHGASKSKGGLRVHTHNDIMDSLVAGNPGASELMNRISLNPDHEDVMPPNGNVLSKQEQDVIKAWIASGAK